MTDFSSWNLNWADFLIIGIVLISSVISIARGFVKEIISLITWILAIWVAIRFYVPLSDMLSDWINTPSARLVSAFLLLLVCSILLGAIFNFLLHGLVHRAGLGGFNRLVGVLFGFARGVLMVGFLLLMARHTAATSDPWWHESTLIPHFQVVADTLSNIIPEKVHQISRLLSDEKPSHT